VLGVLNLADRADGKPFNQDQDLALVEQIAELLAISLRNLQLFENLQRRSRVDSLTRLLSHQAFMEELAREVARVERHETRLSVVMMAIDRFRVINDGHGHLAGDYVLDEIARAVRSTVRNVDIVARYGGDEFCIILPATHFAGSLVVASRIWRDIAQKAFDASLDTSGLSARVTASLGVALFPSRDVRTKDALLGALEAALLEAKRRGGNRLCVFQQEGFIYTPSAE
jgi:diguanylate cyclase (GGDEF)-like protein